MSVTSYTVRTFRVHPDYRELRHRELRDRIVLWLDDNAGRAISVAAQRIETVDAVFRDSGVFIVPELTLPTDDYVDFTAWEDAHGEKLARRVKLPAKCREQIDGMCAILGVESGRLMRLAISNRAINLAQPKA
jgi:hypothetical protein